MNSPWKLFHYDPIAPLQHSDHKAIQYFTKKYLLEEKVPSVSSIWDLDEPHQVLKKQSPEGLWKSRTKNREKAPAVNYDLFETFKRFSILVDMYEFTREKDSIKKASEFLFSCQTAEGDIRGILGEQYAPYYTGLILSLLIKAGYAEDKRVEKGLEWLLKMRQNDGGWVIGSPGCFGQYPKDIYPKLSSHFVGTKKDFDFTKPFTHSGTGMVIRAFAVHPSYRRIPESLKAAELLKAQFFLKDNSTSYQHPDNWVNFKFPFFWTDLISALDSLSLIGIPMEDPQIEKAIHWLVGNQLDTGLWDHSYSKIHKKVRNEKTYQYQLWISLAICRLMKRFYVGVVK